MKQQYIIKVKRMTAVFILLLFVAGGVALAQTPHDLYGRWVKRAAFGSGGMASISRSVVDGAGNVYIAGKFTGMLNFSDDLCVPVTSTAAGSLSNSFLVKFDADGKFQWIVTVDETSGSDGQEGVSPTVLDYANGKLLFGNISSAYKSAGATLPLQTTYTGPHGTKVYNTESAPDETSNNHYHMHTLQVIDAATGTLGVGIGDIPTQGSIFSTGTADIVARFEGNSIFFVHFGYGSIYTPISPNQSIASTFNMNTQTFSSNVYHNQPYPSGSDGSRIRRHLTLPDNSNILVHLAQDYNGTVGISTYYLLKYNADFSTREAYKTISTRSIDFNYAPALSCDNSSNLYIATNYGDNKFWDGSGDVTNSNTLTDFLGSTNPAHDFQTAAQKNRVVLARLNPANLNIVWAKQIGTNANSGTDEVYFSDIKTKDVYTYLTGRFSGTDVPFGDGKKLTSTGVTGSPDGFDGFYAVYRNSDGYCEYAVKMGGTKADNNTTLFLSDDAGKVLIGGNYSSPSLQVDPSGRLYPLTSSGTQQGFVALYSTDPASTPASYTSSYGDAPESYGTAVHYAFPCLRIGSLDIAKVQHDPVYSFYANSDVNDDGFSPQITPDGCIDLTKPNNQLQSNGDFTLSVQASTPPNEAAQMVAWIDFNRDGVFDPSEASNVATITANQTNQAIQLTWANAKAHIRNGRTYLRIRLSTELSLDADRPTGLFFNGEVEDYALNFNVLEVSKIVMQDVAKIGDTLIYRISVKNNTPAEWSVTELFDPLPPYTNYAANSASPVATTGNVTVGGQTLAAIQWPSATLAAGETKEYLFKATVTDAPQLHGADSMVANIAYALTNGDSIPSTGTTCDKTELEIIAFRAVNDAVILWQHKPSMIHVLGNDFTYPSCTPALTTPNDATRGSATVVNDSIYYVPNDPNFEGRDSMTYTIACPLGVSTAKVYIVLAKAPDNIIEADCYGTPPAMPWTIKKLTESTVGLTATTASVNHYLIPMAGDIDGDGKVEIITGMNDQTNSAMHNVNKLTIFEMVNNTLVVQQQLSLGAYINTVGSNMGIANVDGNSYAAIFVATSTYGAPNVSVSSTPQAADAQRKLVKYIYNGTAYELYKPIAQCPQYSTADNRDAAQPMFADFNGDGIPEVVVLDKVYDARTLELLADGGIQASTYPAANYQYGLGYGGHVNNNVTGTITHKTSHMAIADMDNDGIPEVVAGHCVYKVEINNPSGVGGNSFKLWSRCDSIGPNGERHNEVRDGTTTIADMDGDGFLDVIVTGYGKATNNGSFYIWNPRTKHVMHTTVYDNLPAWSAGGYSSGSSRALAGDVDGDGEIELVFLTSPLNNSSVGAGRLYCMKFNRAAKTIAPLWTFNNKDNSAGTTLTLFDFNNDGKAELVYRDTEALYIIDGQTGQVPTGNSFTGIGSGTANEYPLILDVNNDGHAEIVATGNYKLWVFSSDPPGNWAPARKVWNQVPYNVVNVNDDLTIPSYQVNPSTAFPGADKILGTADDIYPYNNFLQQQTKLGKEGATSWLLPDASIRETLTGVTIAGASVTVRAGIINQGDASIGPPVHITLYSNDTLPGRKIASASANIMIIPGDTGYVEATIPNILDTIAFPALKNLTNIVVRIDDEGTVFPYYDECDTGNNILKIFHPSPRLLMTKNARLEGVGPVKNGIYANPVSVLANEKIHYQVIARNVNLRPGAVIIRDTLPAYLEFVPGSEGASSGAVFTASTVTGVPSRAVLRWEFSGIAPHAVVDVTYQATPASGVCGSQPLFINRANITVSDTVNVESNSTYHQGAGISLVTFSATPGGSLYNAVPQAIDYRTSPHAGVVIAPDAGYRFTGWSHDAYTSLRAVTIPARSGIMHLDTLTVYGDVELRAVFEAEEYPVSYYLNGGTNGAGNPSAYTVESKTITLLPAFREDDVFTGWTGSNGEEPQLKVTITGGSTGALHFYANYLYNGRETEPDAFSSSENEDKIWAYEGDLYVKTSRPGSVVRIYTAAGVLQTVRTLLTTGETKIRLPFGVYVVTINNGVGRKAVIVD